MNNFENLVKPKAENTGSQKKKEKKFGFQKQKIKIDAFQKFNIDRTKGIIFTPNLKNKK